MIVRLQSNLVNVCDNPYHTKYEEYKRKKRLQFCATVHWKHQRKIKDTSLSIYGMGEGVHPSTEVDSV